MNIFVVNEDPGISAMELCDQHVVKMPTESTQLLSTALHARGLWNQSMYAPVTRHNPVIVSWPQESWANFVWLGLHTEELFREYSKRFAKRHGAMDAFECCLLTLHQYVRDSGPLPHWSRHTPFIQSMPDKYKHPDPVQAYRNFYICDKSRFARWKPGRRPCWMNEAPILVDTGVDCAHGLQRDRPPHTSDVRRSGEAGLGQSRGRRRVNRRGKSGPAARPRGQAEG